MQQRSGLGRAGEILLLVGGILRIVGGALMALIGIFFASLLGSVFASSRSSSGAPPPGWLPGFIAGFYVVIGIVVAAGGIVGIVGWKRAKNGDLGGAFVWGLVGSLLPPVDILLLLGAIFCKVSEGQAPQAMPPPYGFQPVYPPYPPPPGYPPRPPQTR